MLSTRFGYGLPAALAIAFALAFFAGDSFFVLPSDRGRGLSQTSPPSLNWVKSVSSLRTFFLPLGILEGFISPIPRLGLMLLSFHEYSNRQHV